MISTMEMLEWYHQLWQGSVQSTVAWRWQTMQQTDCPANGIERKEVGFLLEQRKSYQETSTLPFLGILFGGESVEMVKAGTIDPVKIISTALTNTASGSSLLTTAEAIFTNLPKDEPPAFQPGCTIAYPFERSQQSEGENKIQPSIERKPSAPEFYQKITRKPFRMHGCSTPAWVKAELKLVSQSRLQSRESCGSRAWSLDTAQGRNRQMHSSGITVEPVVVVWNRLRLDRTTDLYTIIRVLQMCSKQKDLLVAKQVHKFIIESGMEKDSHVAGTLLDVYIKCGRLLEARLVFDALENKSVMNWNMMIAAYAKGDRADSALELFNVLRQQSVRPNEVTYVCILKACASKVALELGKEIHLCVQHAGFESDVRVGTALIQMYIRCGCLTEARQVFHRMQKRDVVIWGAMIGGLAQHGCGQEAYRLFLQMKREGFEPSAITYLSILNASASVGALDWVKDLHAHARKAGLESNVKVGNAFIHMYAKSGNIDVARQGFDRMEKRDLFTWNIMIGGIANHGCGQEAYKLFQQMRREGFEPDAITYMSILNAAESGGALEWVKDIHAHARKAGLESDVRVGNALVNAYAKSGQIADSQVLFDRMEKRNVSTWNTMIGGLAQGGCGHEAYRLFLQMRKEGFEPDAITYISVLNSSSSAGALEWVRDVHGHARKAGLDSDMRVGNALIHTYAQSGSLDDARLVFSKMKTRDVITWTAMIGGLAQHGCAHEALELFRKMNANLVKPDGTTFVAVLSACCHGGLVDDGRTLFSAMTQDYGIEPDVVHYTCMVDLFGRAGRLEEAKNIIIDMPFKSDAVTLTALLGACRTYGNVALGEQVAKELFKLEPKNDSTYVLLSNIYAAAGKWEKVSWVRGMMRKGGVRKEPGRSWIEVDKKIHEFVVGDTSHPEAKEIKSFLNNLTEKLKVEGYSPDTQSVLHNIDEEFKELALCSHSERLAIAYGLMHVRKGEPIRVCKNLRVCPDCHTATKFISKVTGREIIARDPNRFHHFKDGICSCGDYW